MVASSLRKDKKLSCDSTMYMNSAGHSVNHISRVSPKTTNDSCKNSVNRFDSVNLVEVIRNQYVKQFLYSSGDELQGAKYLKTLRTDPKEAISQNIELLTPPCIPTPGTTGLGLNPSVARYLDSQRRTVSALEQELANEKSHTAEELFYLRDALERMEMEGKKMKQTYRSRVKRYQIQLAQSCELIEQQKEQLQHIQDELKIKENDYKKTINTMQAVQEELQKKIIYIRSQLLQISKKLPKDLFKLLELNKTNIESSHSRIMQTSPCSQKKYEHRVKNSMNIHSSTDSVDHNTEYINNQDKLIKQSNIPFTHHSASWEDEFQFCHYLSSKLRQTNKAHQSYLQRAMIWAKNNKKITENDSIISPPLIPETIQKQTSVENIPTVHHISSTNSEHLKYKESPNRKKDLKRRQNILSGTQQLHLPLTKPICVNDPDISNDCKSHLCQMNTIQQHQYVNGSDLGENKLITSKKVKPVLTTSDKREKKLNYRHSRLKDTQRIVNRLSVSAQVDRQYFPIKKRYNKRHNLLIEDTETPPDVLEQLTLLRNHSSSFKKDVVITNPFNEMNSLSHTDPYNYYNLHRADEADYSQDQPPKSSFYSPKSTISLKSNHAHTEMRGCERDDQSLPPVSLMNSNHSIEKEHTDLFFPAIKTDSIENEIDGLFEINGSYPPLVSNNLKNDVSDLIPFGIGVKQQSREHDNSITSIDLTTIKLPTPPQSNGDCQLNQERLLYTGVVIEPLVKTISPIEMIPLLSTNMRKHRQTDSETSNNVIGSETME